MFLYIFALFLVLKNSHAACDNQCSGHGTCTIDDICQCYDNFGLGLGHISGDCSDRICPYEISWIDTPSITGKFHKYAECAGKGICSRDTGECACLDGFEGKACQRTSCPNGCSGHGTCQFIEDLSYGVTWSDYSDSELNPDGHSYIYSYPKRFPYADWDTRKSRACVCDAGYGGTDCSKKLCPYGADVLNTPDNLLLISTKYYKQEINIVSSENLYFMVGSSFALTFISKTHETFTTQPIVFDLNTANFQNDIKRALMNLPNKVIDDVEVVVRISGKKQVTIIIAYSGENVQGPQNYIVVETDPCNKPGCSPKITGLPLATQIAAPFKSTQNYTQENATFYNSFECGRRGKCDYTSGQCKCFLGYTGDNCNTLTTLA